MPELTQEQARSLAFAAGAGYVVSVAVLAVGLVLYLIYKREKVECIDKKDASVCSDFDKKVNIGIILMAVGGGMVLLTTIAVVLFVAVNTRELGYVKEPVSDTFTFVSTVPTIPTVPTVSSGALASNQPALETPPVPAVPISDDDDLELQKQLERLQSIESDEPCVGPCVRGRCIVSYAPPRSGNCVQIVKGTMAGPPQSPHIKFAKNVRDDLDFQNLEPNKIRRVDKLAEFTNAVFNSCANAGANIKDFTELSYQDWKNELGDSFKYFLQNGTLPPA